MLRSLSALALGGCVFGTAFVAQRLIAPYAGLSLTLFTGVLAATLLGFAIGAGESGNAAAALRRAAWLLAGAAIAAPIVGYVLAPRFGLTVTLAVLAAVEGILAFSAGVRRAPALASAAVLAVLGASAI